MEAFILDWLNLLVRWFHVIAGIAWIGSSFYFVWLDNSLENPPEWKKKKGIKGDLWSIHGGGIYEIAKYNLEPEQMPKTLHWFKWEAYSTWLSGIALLSVLYYAQASSYMLGGSITDPTVAVATGIGLILLSQVLYEGMVRSPLKNHGLLFGVLLATWLSFVAYISMQLFSPRAGMIHLGAAIGTIMAGNVFMGIMPAQRELVKAIEEGRQPDQAPALFAKLRSTHNNYLTLPIILCMIGNHYPFMYAHEYGWALLAAICMVSAYARHFFNLKHKGIIKPAILIQSAIAMLIIAIMASYSTWQSSQIVVAADVPTVTNAQVLQIMNNRCTSCHATKPTQVGFTAPPAGISLETTEQIKQYTQQVHQAAVASNYMPLGNMTAMTDDERELLGVWLNQQPN